MSTYAIGDVQGCFAELQALLTLVNFDASKDTLWFTGDLVNRGPQSLEVLRFVKSLGDKAVTVLGNHDLHLIALAYGWGRQHESDTFAEILAAPDRDDLIEWLRHKSLMRYDVKSGFAMAHAGIAPFWSIQHALQLAKEVEDVLQGKQPENFFANMYGNTPDQWDSSLTGFDRLRCIVNYFTRMRFCYVDGRIDFSYKGDLRNRPAELIPWFDLPNRVNANEKIIFGHWAALGGVADVPNVYPLDTGCVWGNSLTGMRLEDEKHFKIACSKK